MGRGLGQGCRLTCAQGCIGCTAIAHGAGAPQAPPRLRTRRRPGASVPNESLDRRWAQEPAAVAEAEVGRARWRGACALSSCFRSLWLRTNWNVASARDFPTSVTPSPRLPRISNRTAASWGLHDMEMGGARTLLFWKVRYRPSTNLQPRTGHCSRSAGVLAGVVPGVLVPGVDAGAGEPGGDSNKTCPAFDPCRTVGADGAACALGWVV
jgi:hypothetical protein